MASKVKMFMGFDYECITNFEVSGFAIRSNIGTESADALLAMEPASNTTQNEVVSMKRIIKDLSPDQIKALLKGEASLEFWIVAIRHNQRTINRKLYPKEVFWDGMEGDFMKQIELGGVPGEAEHPLVQLIVKPNVNPAKGEVDINHFNAIRRTSEKDPDKETHKVIGVRCDGDTTYFKIRTSLKRLDIVKDIIQGRMPTFSIRTFGDFADPDSEGTIVARKIAVFGTDYVCNPAVVESTLIDENITFIDPINMVNVSARFGNESVSSLGFESASMEGIIKGEKEVYISNESSLLSQLMYMPIVDKCEIGNESVELDEVKARVKANILKSFLI